MWIGFRMGYILSSGQAPTMNFWSYIECLILKVDHKITGKDQMNMLSWAFPY